MNDIAQPEVRSFNLRSRLEALSKEELERMRIAGEEVLNCQRVLRKTSSNVVAELLRHQGTFFEWNHYPKGDAVDMETHSQYYYHAHPKSERPGEHGHFHTFLRYSGMPSGVEPLALEHPQKPNENRIGTHIIALSCDKKGYAIKLFTVNRWVTDETWYPAAEVARMIDKFDIDHTFPSWATNRWLSSAIILFKPQIVHLLNARDQQIEAWKQQRPGEDVYEIRDFEVASELTVNVETQVKALKSVLSHAPRAASSQTPD